MREIVLDTETTGLDPRQGHRIVEIGCVELKNHRPTGQVFHVYINPEREVPEEAARVHGLKYDFLKNHPTFDHHVDKFLEFIGEDPLVIHNAPFDMKFLNAELSMLSYPELPMSRAIDTLRMAKVKFPGSPASLDRLCSRFKIDNSHRQFHGAILDAHLLAKVYFELLVGINEALFFGVNTKEKDSVTPLQQERVRKDRPMIQARDFSVTVEEKEAHEGLLKKLKNPIWTGS